MPDEVVPARTRVSFSKIPEVLPLPDLIGIQRESFDQLLDAGIREVLAEVSPIEDFTGTFQLVFGKHQFKEIKHSVEECKDKDMTFSAPLFVEAAFINKETGEIKEQEVFMGDFPMMTDKGTFVINGTERVVVSQLVRSPGVYFSKELDKTSDKDLYIAKIIPSRGAWLEFEVDKRDTVGVRIDRKRRQNVTVLLKALGWTVEQIVELFGGARSVQLTLDKDHFATAEESLEDIYRKLRPGDPPTPESARTLLENLFFNSKRYDLARVGRYKVDKKLGARDEATRRALDHATRELSALENPDRSPWEQPTWRVTAEMSAASAKASKAGKVGPTYKGILTYEDILKTVQYLVRLHAGEDGYETDDIDHFGNRRLRIGRRADPEPAPHRPVSDGAGGEGADDHAGRRGHHAPDPDQHPAGGGFDQGVLRDLAALAVHGPDEPARRPDPQAPAVGARPRRPFPRTRWFRGP